MPTDLEIMRMLRDAHAHPAADLAVDSAGGSEQSCGWQYAVVLTKVDKVGVGIRTALV